MNPAWSALATIRVGHDTDRPPEWREEVVAGPAAVVMEDELPLLGVEPARQPSDTGWPSAEAVLVADGRAEMLFARWRAGGGGTAMTGQLRVREERGCDT